MTIQEAIKSKRPFRRKAWELNSIRYARKPRWIWADSIHFFEWYSNDDDFSSGREVDQLIYIEDILADDWENPS